jgi:hypothetical protein
MAPAAFPPTAIASARIANTSTHTIVSQWHRRHQSCALPEPAQATVRGQRQSPSHPRARRKAALDQQRKSARPAARVPVALRAQTLSRNQLMEPRLLVTFLTAIRKVEEAAVRVAVCWAQTVPESQHRADGRTDTVELRARWALMLVQDPIKHIHRARVST